MTSPRGLSLVELLVTLAIVVILLALLVPALNKAIYQSDLAACGANLKAVAAGSLAYAGGYGKTYPIPPLGIRWGTSMHLLMEDPKTDLRPVIKGYINLKQLVCPLSPTISLAVEDAGEAGFVFTSYGYWSGWRYIPKALPEAGMFKIGNRWSWSGKSFSVIATDSDHVLDGSTAAGSHPDEEGRMVPESMQEKDGANYSQWIIKDNRPRSRIDFNAAFDDGSVRRYGDVEPLDTRMVRVPFAHTWTEPHLNVR